MDVGKLIVMANQIAAFFAAEPDRKLAIEGVAGHLKKFWEPRMRREILAAFDQNGGAGMHDLVAAALHDHRTELEPAPAATS